MKCRQENGIKHTHLDIWKIWNISTDKIYIPTIKMLSKMIKLNYSLSGMLIRMNWIILLKTTLTDSVMPQFKTPSNLKRKPSIPSHGKNQNQSSTKIMTNKSNYLTVIAHKQYTKKLIYT